jgi:RNA polymerase sigma-70 factor (family 1)
LSTPIPHNQSQLVEAMQTGDQEAFTILYRHYSPLLYMNILRMLHDPQATEELVQELFTRIWQKRSCKGIREDFTGYMYRIAQNLVYDFFRRLKKDHALMEKFKALTEEADATANAEEKLHQQQAAGIISNAIEHLPPQQKKVYKLVKENGYTYKKAAEDLGISPFTVKEYLVLANKSIRNYVLTHADPRREIMLLVLAFLTSL